LRASLEKNIKTRLPESFVRLGLNIDSAELQRKAPNKPLPPLPQGANTAKGSM
jgi:hypothetical protein